MRPSGRRFGFTLIELLTVIAIIMMLVALALPNFVAMMKGRRWSSAVSNIQLMVMRARAIATNSRSDMSVEFDVQGDNGTALWIESETNAVETVENLNTLALFFGNGNFSVGKRSVNYLTDSWTPGPWYAAGGRDLHPNGPDSYGDFVYPPDPGAVLPDRDRFGDNARQSEVVRLGPTVTIDPDPTRSPNFVSYDAPVGPTAPYGKDDYRDIRIGFAGALTQTLEPVICLREIRGEDRYLVTVIRCTGRVVVPK